MAARHLQRGLRAARWRLYALNVFLWLAVVVVSHWSVLMALACGVVAAVVTSLLEHRLAYAVAVKTSTQLASPAADAAAVLADRLGLDHPLVLFRESEQLAATLAYGRRWVVSLGPRVAALPGQLQAAVLVHEYGHQRYGHTSPVMILPASLYIFMSPVLLLLWAPNMFVLGLLIAVSMLSLELADAAWRRRCEYVADGYVAEVLGNDCAIEMACWMVDTFKKPSRGWCATHPTPERRMQRLVCRLSDAERSTWLARLDARQSARAAQAAIS